MTITAVSGTPPWLFQFLSGKERIVFKRLSVLRAKEGSEEEDRQVIASLATQMQLTPASILRLYRGAQRSLDSLNNARVRGDEATLADYGAPGAVKAEAAGLTSMVDLERSLVQNTLDGFLRDHGLARYKQDFLRRLVTHMKIRELQKGKRG